MGGHYNPPKPTFKPSRGMPGAHGHPASPTTRPTHWIFVAQRVQNMFTESRASPLSLYPWFLNSNINPAPAIMTINKGHSNEQLLIYPKSGGNRQNLWWARTRHVQMEHGKFLTPRHKEVCLAANFPWHFNKWVGKRRKRRREISLRIKIDSVVTKT